MGIAKYWNESNRIIVKQQRMYSSETLQQPSSAVRISHFAMNIIMAQALPNRQSQSRGSMDVRTNPRGETHQKELRNTQKSEVGG